MQTPTQIHHCCPLCSNSKLKPLSTYAKNHLLKCRVCGFVFSQIKYSQEVLQKLYWNYSRTDYLSPITIKRYNELLDKFEKYRLTNKILDIGCGIGYFLEIAKNRGWEIYGSEYTDEAIRICKTKGITIVDDYSLYNNQFDIISSFEVIEHYENPLDELNKHINCLRKDGIYYITTPNFNSITRYLLKSKWTNVITTPEHLSYFSPKSMQILFKKFSFKKETIITTGISIHEFIKRDNSVSPINPNSSDEIIRLTIEHNNIIHLLAKMANSFLSFFKIGDTIKAIFIKL